MKRVSRVRLERGEGFMVSLFRTVRDSALPELVEDVYIDPDRGDDKTGDGTSVKPFKSVKPLEHLWPKRVMP